MLGRYNLALAGKFKPYGYLGPQLSYNIDARRMISTREIRDAKTLVALSFLEERPAGR